VKPLSRFMFASSIRPTTKGRAVEVLRLRVRVTPSKSLTLRVPSGRAYTEVARLSFEAFQDGGYSVTPKAMWGATTVVTLEDFSLRAYDWSTLPTLAELREALKLEYVDA